MTFERSIKVAFDKISGQVLEAKEIFKESKPGFEVRRQFHKNDVDLYCCECEQPLNISGSKYDRLHFKHRKGAEACLLKDSKLSPHETELISRIYKAKESDRHKELKHKIGQLLSGVEGVSDIHVDDRFIIRDQGRRKPDVWCKYNDKELVFEIQLSALSLRYILDRYEFYRAQKMYLIWILDDFDVRGQSQTERDIKYLTEFQNFFKLDESYDRLHLECSYKYLFLTDDNRLLTKWLSKSVRLDQIKFSERYYQIYYYNFEQNLKIREAEQERNTKRIAEERRQEEEAQRLYEAEEKVENLLYRLGEKWTREAVVFDDIQESINQMDSEEMYMLNHSRGFQPKNGEPRIHHWFSIAKQGHQHFLLFMLGCYRISLDVNVKSADGHSLLKTLFTNTSITTKLHLTKQILKRGYQFLESDEALIHSLPLKEKHKASRIILCHLATRLHTPHLVDKLFEHGNLICTIESARRNEVVGFGFKPDQWISFANNAIHSYKEYWDYIEIAFRHYGIWSKLIRLDRNGTFQKKLDHYYQTQPPQNYDCDRLFQVLYPELIQ